MMGEHHQHEAHQVEADGLAVHPGGVALNDAAMLETRQSFLNGWCRERKLAAKLCR